MQSRKMSMVEILTNISLGLVISFLMTLCLLPVWGFKPKYTDAAEITALYTVVSMVRSYVVRRCFNCLVR